MDTLNRLLTFTKLNGSVTLLSFSLTIGAFFGLLPLISLVSGLMLVVLLVFRVNFILLVIGWLIGEGLSYLLAIPISSFGEWLLTYPSLQPLWQQWYADPWWRLFNFNNTYIMGISVLMVILLLPLWGVLLSLFKAVSWKMVRTPISNSLFLSKNAFTRTTGWFGQTINGFGVISLLILSGIFAVGVYWGGAWYLGDWTEEKMQQLWGAPVTIDSANLHLFPLKLELSDVTFKGLNESENDAMHWANLNVEMDFYHAIMGRLVINQMEIDEVTVNFAEFTPNTPKSKTNSKIGNNSANSSILNFPSIKEVFAQEPLQTIAYASSIQILSAKVADVLQANQQLLPTQQQLSEYQQQLSDIQKSNVDDNATLANLTAQINQSYNQFTTINRQLNLEIEQLLTLIRQVPLAPDVDWQKLNQKYSLRATNQNNLVALLYAKKVTQSRELLQYWFPTLKQRISEIKGELKDETKDSQESKTVSNEQSSNSSSSYLGSHFVEFADKNLQSGFIIKKLKVTSTSSAPTPWQLRLSNVNFDHANNQLLTKGTFTLLPVNSSTSLTSKNTFNLSFDYRNALGISQLSYLGEREPVVDKVLLSNKNLSMIVKSALQSNDFSFKLTADGKIEGHWDRLFQSIQWDSERMNESVGNQMRPGIFDKINELQTRLLFSGDVPSPIVTFESELGDYIYSSLQQALNRQQDEFSIQLRQALREQTVLTLKTTRSQLIKLNNLRQQVAKRQQDWQQQLLSRL